MSLVVFKGKWCIKSQDVVAFEEKLNGFAAWKWMFFRLREIDALALGDGFFQGFWLINPSKRIIRLGSSLSYLGYFSPSSSNISCIISSSESSKCNTITFPMELYTASLKTIKIPSAICIVRASRHLFFCLLAFISYKFLRILRCSLTFIVSKTLFIKTPLIGSPAKL